MGNMNLDYCSGRLHKKRGSRFESSWISAAHARHTYTYLHQQLTNKKYTYVTPEHLESHTLRSWSLELEGRPGVVIRAM